MHMLHVMVGFYAHVTCVNGRILCTCYMCECGASMHMFHV